MEQRKDEIAVIHGTGLMGASIGLGLRAAGWKVFGWDPDPAAGAKALERGAIETVLPDDQSGLDEAGLLILAGPPSATIDALTDLDTGLLVTDIASVKGPVVEAGRGLTRFVPGHPMAGTAFSGAEHASGHLFHGATWILCDDLAGGDDIEILSGVVSTLGANPVVMSAELHDHRVALVSHLPRVLASTLVELADASPGAHDVAAGSFRDLTRVAGSDADWWTDILVANQGAMTQVLTELQQALELWKPQISTDPAAVSDRLERTRQARAHLGPPVTAVRVILFDKPGEIGHVGRALEKSGVDLRDLQLRHAEYGGGGVLTLSVSESEAPLLRDALADAGFELED